MSLPIPIFAFIPMSAAAFIHNRWGVELEQKESETSFHLWWKVQRSLLKDASSS